MPSFTFTQEEVAYLKRTTEKLMQIRRELQPKDWKKPEHKIVREMHAKFSTEAEQYVLSRTHIRGFLQLLTAGTKMLSETTIPEYERRIASDASKTEFYQPYLDKAKNMQQMFDGLIVKLEGGL